MGLVLQFPSVRCFGTSLASLSAVSSILTRFSIINRTLYGIRFGFDSPNMRHFLNDTAVLLPLISKKSGRLAMYDGGRLGTPLATGIGD